MTSNQFDSILAEIKNISRGDHHPCGLEAVTMALGGRGDPGETSVTDGLYAIASAIHELSEAIRERNAS